MFGGIIILKLHKLIFIIMTILMEQITNER